MDKIVEFENGLKLAMTKMAALKSVSCGIYVGTGSSFETKEENGISHFIEHMVFKGTKNRSSFEISDSVDRIGGQINAYTTKELTCFYTRTMSNYLETSLDILSDLIFNPLFDEEEMEREKGVVLEEISMVEDTPDEICMDVLAELFFKGNRIGQTILGTADNVKSFTPAKLREYMKNYYTPNNIVVSIAGDLDFEKTEELVRKYFKTEYFQSTICNVVVPKTVTPSFSYKIKSKKIEQCHVGIALPSIAFNDINAEKYSILNNIFGNGMSSRLFQEIREKKGLAYTVYSSHSTYKNNGAFVVYAGVNPNNVDNTILTIISEIEKLKKNGVTKEEFLRGREQLKGGIILGRENTAAVMNVNGKFVLFTGKPYVVEEKIAKIDSVKEGDIDELAKSAYCLDNACISVIGKYSGNISKLFKV